MPARTPRRHESQGGNLCRGQEDRADFLEELRGRVGRSALDAGRYGYEALLAFLGGVGKPVEDLTPADLERLREAQRQRVEVGELRPLKAQAIQQGVRSYLRFLARQGRLDEGLFFFDLYPHPSAVEPELSERARRLMQATECLSVGVSPARGGQYRRGAMLLLLFLERQGCRLEDMDEGRWLAFRRELLGEEKARLSTTALANDPRSRLLTGARAFLRLQAERGRLRPQQVPQSVMPIEASRRQPRGGLPGGVARLVRFLERRGKNLAGLTAEDLRAFIDGARTTRGDRAAWLLESVRAYLRQQARGGQPLEQDLVPLVAPGNFDEQRALYLLKDPTLAPLFTEAEDFARWRKAQGYLGEGGRIGAFRLLIFLRCTGKSVEGLTAQDWHVFAGTVSHQAHLVEAGRAYARYKAGEGVLPRPVRKPLYPDLPAGLVHLPRLLEDAMRASDLGELTRPGFRRALRDLLVWLMAEGLTDLSAVTRDVLADYRLQLQTRTTKKGQPYAVATQSGHLVGLRFFFSWLFKAGHLLSDPSRHLPYPRAPLLLPRPLKSAEIGKLLASLPKTPIGLRDRALVELLYGTGLRRAEISQLSLEDLDLEARTLLVRQGKGHKDRLVPIGHKAKEALLDYLDLGRDALLRGKPTSALFLTFRGTPLGADDVTGRVRKLGRGVKLRVWPHLLRHTCATHLLRGKADIRHIQRLLGHKSLQTTERYTRVEVGDLRRVIERCHPRERQRT